ncbi:MAG: tRNA pseudouridine(13) synthase TruD [Polyangiales bacterium]
MEFEKRDLSTAEALRRLGRALGVSPRDASVAGLKDRHAITTQWASFFGTTRKRHGRHASTGCASSTPSDTATSRTGHLRANRFELRIRDAAAHVEAGAERPRTCRARRRAEYFGEQRFGRGGKSLDMARAWLLDGGPAPRDKRDRKFMVSVLQARVFNRVLAERVTLNELGAYVEGDLLRKEDTGGLFTTTDTADAAERVRTWAVNATGPMVGAKMRWPEGLAREREVRASAEASRWRIWAFPPRRQKALAASCTPKGHPRRGRWRRYFARVRAAVRRVCHRGSPRDSETRQCRTRKTRSGATTMYKTRTTDCATGV